jgi:hypothetical protein
VEIKLEMTPKEVALLREGMDQLPLQPFAPVILKVLMALPLEDVPAELHTEGVTIKAELPNGMTIEAFTDKGKAMLPYVVKTLSRMKQ